MFEVKNVSKKNLNAVFEVCSYNRPTGAIQEQGKEFRREWNLKMLELYGPCLKIGYSDGAPVAQALFYPEESMPFIDNPRKNVINLKCIFNSRTPGQKTGMGSFLLNNLLDEAKNGLECLGGEPCRFIVTYPFPHEGSFSYTEFFTKHGFRQGDDEMYLEISGSYEPRVKPIYIPSPEDENMIILGYNINCEWGYFAVHAIKDLVQDRFPDKQVEIFDAWRNPEEYRKRPVLPSIVGTVVVNTHYVYPFDFWTDQELFVAKVREALLKPPNY